MPSEPTYLALEVVVACKQKTPRDGRSDGGNAAEDRFGLDGNLDVSIATDMIPAGPKTTYAVDIELTVSTDVEETASCIVGTGDKGVSVGEKLDGVNIGLVTSKSLYSLASSNVPELGKSIASARDEGVLICRIQADAHDVAKMVGELNLLCAGLDVPLHTGHVSG